MARAVVVTGASTGIGEACVKVLAAAGFHVFGAVRKPADGERLAAQFGADFTPLLFDVTDQAAVEAAVRDHQGVLALGGGAVLNEATRTLLRDQPTVWLKVSAAQGAHRVGLDVPRPVLLGNVRGRLSALLTERGPLYEEVAAFSVDTDGRSPEAVVEDIADWLVTRGT